MYRALSVCASAGQKVSLIFPIFVTIFGGSAMQYPSLASSAQFKVYLATSVSTHFASQ